MDPIVHCAEHTLRQSEHPALKLSELLESVSEIVDRTLDAGRLRAILEGHPDRFRILEPWRGPWRGTAGTLMAREGTGEAWVVAVTYPDGPPNGAGPVAIKLRESVRWLARGVDPRSPAEVSRWYALAMSERAVRTALARRAA
jgi:hypothetical protein